MKDRPSAKYEWRCNWPLVLGAMGGMSLGSVNVNTMGLFMAPISQDLGWSRAQISIGLVIFTVLAVPAAPFVGAMVDRWGSRRLALPGTLATGITFAALGLTGNSFAQWIGLWILFTLASLAIKTVVWTAAVSSAFDRGRGLALATALSGTALTATVAPILSQWLIDDYGWRFAFAALGIGWSSFSFLFVYFLFRIRTSPGLSSSSPAGSPAPSNNPGGLTLAQAFGDVTIVRLGISALVSTLLLTALIVHQVPILTDVGISRPMAAMLAGIGGAMTYVGKFLNGWLLDKACGRWLGCINSVLIGAACTLIAWRGDGIIIPAIFVVFIGYAMGAYLQILIYYITRYGGMKAYGAIFGAISSLIALGAGVGPMAGSLIYDFYGNYQLLLTGGALACVVCALLLANLKPYPAWDERPAVEY